MSESAPAGAVSAPVRDFDGLYKALLAAHPRDALHLLCGARLDGREVILEGPTEQPRQRSRQADKVFVVPNGGGLPADVYHLRGSVLLGVAGAEVSPFGASDSSGGGVAAESLAAQILEALRRRGMSNVLEQSETGREIARRNLEQGLINGMRALLRARYGEIDDLDDLARRLAEQDLDGNMARIVAGATLAELRS